MSGGRATANTLREGNVVMVWVPTGGYRAGVIEEIDWENDWAYLTDNEGAEFDCSIQSIELKGPSL